MQGCARHAAIQGVPLFGAASHRFRWQTIHTGRSVENDRHSRRNHDRGWTSISRVRRHRNRELETHHLPPGPCGPGGRGSKQTQLIGGHLQRGAACAGAERWKRGTLCSALTCVVSRHVTQLVARIIRGVEVQKLAGRGRRDGQSNGASGRIGIRKNRRSRAGVTGGIATRGDSAGRRGTRHGVELKRDDVLWRIGSPATRTCDRVGKLVGARP